jgi:hypothetical protein
MNSVHQFGSCKNVILYRYGNVALRHYQERNNQMQTIAPPKVGWRVCLKHDREATGVVTEVSRNTIEVEVDKGNDTFQRVRFHSIRIRWEGTPRTNPPDWVSCSLITILNPRTSSEIVAELREMVKRRKKAYGSGRAANEAFLKDEVLQEVAAILKGGAW